MGRSIITFRKQELWIQRESQRDDGGDRHREKAGPMETEDWSNTFMTKRRLLGYSEAMKRQGKTPLQTLQALEGVWLSPCFRQLVSGMGRLYTAVYIANLPSLAFVFKAILYVALRVALICLCTESVKGRWQARNLV